MNAKPLRCETVESAPFGENTYIVFREPGGDAVVIDPGFDTDAVDDMLDRHRLRVATILNTHGHLDHIFGNERLKQRFPAAPLVIEPGPTLVSG